MTIIEMSARIGRGEIDIIAVDGETVVFVEVKSRRTHATGHPAEAVDARKQIQLTRLALQYMRRHNLLDYAWRFDIVAVTWPKDARRPTVEHLPGAFAPCGVESMFT
jgi:putative endonuclease